MAYIINRVLSKCVILEKEIRKFLHLNLFIPHNILYIYYIPTLTIYFTYLSTLQLTKVYNKVCSVLEIRFLANFLTMQ